MHIPISSIPHLLIRDVYRVSTVWSFDAACSIFEQVANWDRKCQREMPWQLDIEADLSGEDVLWNIVEIVTMKIDDILWYIKWLPPTFGTLSHPLVLNTISPMKLNGNFCWDKLPVGSCDIYGRNNMDSYDLKAPSAILLSSAMSRAWLWTLQKCVETNEINYEIKQLWNQE